MITPTSPPESGLDCGMTPWTMTREEAQAFTRGMIAQTGSLGENDNRGVSYEDAVEVFNADTGDLGATSRIDFQGLLKVGGGRD